MRIAIVGSRDFYRLDLVRNFVASLDPGDVVVSGGARGVDRVAAQAARSRGLAVVEFLPDWERDGKRAGFIRNRLIVDYAERGAAFWDGTSRGTQSTIAMFNTSKKPIQIVRDIARSSSK